MTFLIRPKQATERPSLMLANFKNIGRFRNNSSIKFHSQKKKISTFNRDPLNQARAVELKRFWMAAASIKRNF